MPGFDPNQKGDIENRSPTASSKEKWLDSGTSMMAKTEYYRRDQTVGLMPKVTGLFNTTIWLHRSKPKTSMFISASPAANWRKPHDAFQHPETALIILEPQFHETSGLVPDEEIEEIRTFVEWNMDVIDDYWTWSEKSLDELVKRVRPLYTIGENSGP